MLNRLKELFLKDEQIVPKLTSGLLHFKQLQQSNGLNVQNIPDMKWGGKDPITRRLYFDLVQKLSEVLNLDESLAFDLLEVYFITDEQTRKMYAYIKTLDSEIEKAESLQGLGGQSSLIYQNKLHSIEICRKELTKSITEVINGATSVFFSERISLLSSILAILSGPESQKEIRDLVQQMKPTVLSGNLISSIKRNKNQYEETFMNLNSQRSIIASLQREEIIVLQCLLKIYRHYEIPTASDILTFVEYQLPDFKGLKFPMHGYQADILIQAQEKKIEALSILHAFNLFQVNLFSVEDPKSSKAVEQFVRNLFSKPAEFQQVQQMICSDMLIDDAKATIYLAFRQVINIIQKLELITKYSPQTKAQVKLDVDGKLRNIQDVKMMDQIKSMSEINKKLEMEMLDRKGELNLLIQDWINIACPYFKQNEAVFPNEINICQELTFSILEQPSHLKYIWDQIDKNKNWIFGKNFKSQIATKVTFNSLDIFENILINPLQEINQFLQLMIALSGNKLHNYEHKILELLQKYTLGQIIELGAGYQNQKYSKMNLMQYLIREFIEYSERLQSNQLSQKDFTIFSNISMFICKIITQSYFVYELLNQEAIVLIQEAEENRVDIEGLERYMINDPLLFTLLQSMHNILYYQSTCEIVDPLNSLIKCLTSIYKRGNAQKLILVYIQSILSNTGQPTLVEFITWYFQEVEYNTLSYKITTTFIKFIDEIFSQSNPWQHLDQMSRTDFDSSLLSLFLNSTYSLILKNFTQLKFIDMKEFFNLYHRLLKLTNTLLTHFKDVIPQMKAPISHRFPQFDQMLRVICEVINSQNTIEFIIINSILLQEEVINSLPTGLTNKFWAACLKQGRVDESNQRIRAQKMIRSALECFNTIMELSYMNSQLTNLTVEQAYQLGARAFYTSKLQCVQNITNFVKNPGQWELYPLQGQTGVNYSAFNIVQYYVKPHQILCPYISQIQIEAIKFFLNCCKIWETQPSGARVNLETIIRTSGLTHQEVLMKYIINLDHCARKFDQPLIWEYLCVFFDLLITASTTQQHFVQDLFKEEMMQKQFVEIINLSATQAIQQRNLDSPQLRALHHEVQSKIVILLAEMSNNRVCDTFILNHIISGQLLSKIQKGIIHKFLEETSKLPIIDDYDGSKSDNLLLQQQITQSNKEKSLNLVSTCSSFITIKYFMQFLQNEYQIHPTEKNEQVRISIASLFQNEKFYQLNQRPPIQEIFSLMLKFNDDMKSFYNRDKDLVVQYCQNVNSSQKLSNVHIDLINDVKNKFITGENCEVFLNNLDASNLFAFLQKVNPYSIIPVNILDKQQYSKVGTEFMINTEELISTARTYFYEDEGLLAAAKGICSSFNMLLSYLYSYNQFAQGLKDFILNIGKFRMRENLKNKEMVISNQALSSSLLNLATAEDVLQCVKNKVTENPSNNLARIMLDIAKTLARKLNGLEQLAGANQDQEMLDNQYLQYLHFESAQNEVELELLTISLGVVNSIAEIQNLSPDNLTTIQNEIINSLIKSLPKVRQNQINKIIYKDQPQIVKFQSEKVAAKLFVSLVLQIFSLSNFLQKKVRQQIQLSYQNDVEHVQILSQTLKIMQDGTSFIEGLKILEQGFSLVSNESFLYFMKKLDISPLRIILQKFQSQGTTSDELIKIIEFLTNYARIEDGAKHLFDEKVFQGICINSLITQVNSNDLYVVEGSEAKRSPIHILWCHVLVFIRTLNHMLLSDNDYRRHISTQVTQLWPRINACLQFGASLKELDQKILSIALFEELDLITGVVQQYFDYCDEFALQDYLKYSEIKDSLLLGVIHFFSNDKIVPYQSATEQYFNSLSMDRAVGGLASLRNLDDRPILTGLDLIVQVEKIRIFQNVTASLLNMLLVNQDTVNRQNLLNTWDEQRPRNVGGSKISEYEYAGQSNLSYMTMPQPGYDSLKGLNYMNLALANFITSLRSMNDMFKQWGLQKVTIGNFFEEVYGLMKHDEWINKEYQGLNHFFAGEDFQDILKKFEQSLEMGYLIALLLLQQFKDLYLLRLEYEQRIDITPKQVIDFGDDIEKYYVQFSKDATDLVAPHTIKLQGQIKSFVESLKGERKFVDRFY